jgi:superfamily II DNA or RNA helicase
MSYHKCLKKEGYLVKKNQLDEKDIKQIKKDLTVSPIVIKAYQDFVKPTKFEIFQESPNYFYLPRYYGIETFGPPKKNKLPEGAPMILKFTYSLLPHQITAHQKTLQALKTIGGGVLQLPCGMGKCLARGTPILMYNGTIKNVEDVVIGDQLMGDDSRPRNVLSLARGHEEMYEIKPIKGDSWACNKSHILSLKCSTNRNPFFTKGSIYDIELDEFLYLPKSFHGLKLYKVPVIFPHKEVDLDPYMLGYWLGASKSDNKHIPIEYKCNSREIQLKVLAGLIDSNGYLSSDCYEITHTSEKLVDDIVFICHSVGFATYKTQTCANSKSECDAKKDPNDKDGIYYKCIIYGGGVEQIPVLLAHKKADPQKQIEDPLVYEFSINPLGVGEYYGFTLDGNGRFLLGDFTVTHNTACAIKVAIDLGRKTLVVVNKECLMDQWSESIVKFTGNQAKVGLIQQDKVDVDGKDFVISMLHSICKKDYPEEIFADFGMCIVDECFTAETHIITNQGPISIYVLYMMWKNGEKLPLIKSFNESARKFEYKELLFSWEKTTSQLIHICFDHMTVCCTPNHKFLTVDGYKKAHNLTSNDQIISHPITKNQSSYDTLHISYIENITDTHPHKVYDIEVATNHNFIVVDQNNKQMSGPVVHNCHHIASEMFSKALPKIATKYMLGLSATPNRKDGLSHVFHKYLGNICHSERRQGKNQVFIKRFKLTSNSPMYETLYMNNGVKNTVAMITNLSKYDVRTALLVEMIRILMTQDRKILLLSGRREHLEQIYDLLGQAQIKNVRGKNITFGYYYGNQGGNKQKHKQMLQESAKCDVVLGTVAIASEGLDLPDLNTEILATPSTDVEQAVGRILRKFHDKVNPIVIDLVDSFGNFSRQASTRNKFYKDEHYEVQDLKIPLGNDVRDLQPFLAEIRDYLLSTSVSPKDTQDSDSDSGDEVPPNAKDIPMFGKCMLDDDESQQSSTKKCLLVEDKPKGPVRTKKCLLADDAPKIKHQSQLTLGKCLLTDDEPKNERKMRLIPKKCQPTNNEPEPKHKSQVIFGKCLLADDEPTPHLIPKKCLLTDDEPKCQLAPKKRESDKISVPKKTLVTTIQHSDNTTNILPKGKCLLDL